MPTDPTTGLPYPASGDAPAGAAAIMALVQALAGASGSATPVLRATDSANRDSKYGGTATPAGVIVVAAATSEVWLKVGTAGTSADWVTIYSPIKTWTPALSQAGTGAAISGTPTTSGSWYQVIGGVAEVHGEVQLNADSTSGLAVSLPIAAAQRYFGIGVLGVYGTRPSPDDQTGVAVMLDTTHLVLGAYSNGFRDGAAGNSLRFHVRYRVA